MTSNGDYLTKLHRVIQKNEAEHLDKLKAIQSDLNKNRHK